MSFSSNNSFHTRSSTSTSFDNASIFSQVSGAQSGPFENVDALDSASSHVLSFYFDPDPDPSEAREPSEPLLQLIRTSGHSGQVLDRLLGMVSMIVHIGNCFFPHTRIIREDIIKEVQFLAAAMIEWLEAVKAFIHMRKEKTKAAFRKLPSPAITDAETLALSISQWTEILDGLHIPNGVEARLFRKMSKLYSSHIYAPFLQLHRLEPDHNMYQALDEHLTPIDILLKTIYREARNVDKLVLEIEEEFELTMSAEPSPALSSRTRTPELTSPSDTPPSVTPKAGELNSGGERKSQHTPSKSAPLPLAIRPVAHQRAETLQ